LESEVTQVVDMQTARRRRRGSVSAATIERAERERKAIALRNQDWTLDQIAAELGYADRSGARKAVERGLSRWMRVTDEEFRARELERTELIIERLWPLIDRDDPDLKAMDQLRHFMNLRAKIMGLFAKRPTVPDTYPGAPNRAAEDKAQMIERYSELAKKLMEGVVASGYGSGVEPYDDDDEQDDDAIAGPESTSSDTAAESDGEDDVLEPMGWVDGKPVWDGDWIDGKLVPSDRNDPGADPEPPKQKRGDPSTVVTEAFRI
jgi:hypothetical protein